MYLRLVLIAVAILVAAGCGGRSKHSAIADYITSVNNVERSMAGPLQEVSLANQKFARAQGNSHVETKLAVSVATLRRLRRRVAQLQAPKEAAHLRAQLLNLVDGEVSLALEVQQLATFVPRYQATLQPLQTASTRLKTELAASAKGAAAVKKLNAAKAGALTTYAQQLAVVAAALRPLDPPAVWRPSYDQQLTSLAHLRAAANALAAAIRARSTAAVPALLGRFDAAAVENRSLDAQRRQIAAVRHYDQQIRALSGLAQRAEKTRAALETRYG